jgi:outer membrane immunogenic protein
VKKLFLGSVALVAIVAARSAPAADLSIPRYKALPPAAPVVAPVYNWTGLYIGAELGGKWTDVDWRATSLGKTGVIDASSPRDYRPSSFRVGGYLGYNWQVAPLWVISLEGDIAWASKTVTAFGFPGCSLGDCVPGTFVVPDGPAGGDTTSFASRWDASLRGRLGFLLTTDLLLYATGGVAWQNIESAGHCGPFATSFYCLGPPQPVPSSITNNTTLTGWTVGGGLEWRIFANWFARAEYRFADFGTKNEVFAFGTPTPGFNTYRYQLHPETHIATFGIAYKF